VPDLPREFRAAWIATVANIDWPSSPNLSAAEQQAELVAILDKVAALNMNAVILQVRPTGDLFYPHDMEPWSAYLTGKQGRPPQPYYDPLAFAIEESHRRGIELHAWFNPFRVQHPAAPDLAPTSIARRKPTWVKQYGDYLWLDPGIPEVHDYVLEIIAEAVARYDLDGVHMDDYFYPYPINDDEGTPLPFPDEESWERYVNAGGALGRDDWRRDNINRFMESLHRVVKEVDPHVKVGISPFGIWRPGHPEQIVGFDPYEKLYADSRIWLQEGWLDYFTPQLYWSIDSVGQSYPVLLDWWVEQNTLGRHIWPGQFTSRIRNRRDNWPASEIINQIYLTRVQEGASGTVHFSVKAIMANRDGIADELRDTYAAPALIPASPWIDDEPPAAPTVAVTLDEDQGQLVFAMTAPPADAVDKWVVQVRYGIRWITRIVPASQSEVSVPGWLDGERPNMAAITSVDRAGNQSAPAIIR
jgi:uncharacterized lipoprotein YddW (UPF0748 family)